jgi:hypothetical protein
MNGCTAAAVGGVLPLDLVGHRRSTTQRPWLAVRMHPPLAHWCHNSGTLDCCGEGNMVAATSAADSAGRQQHIICNAAAQQRMPGMGGLSSLSVVGVLLCGIPALQDAIQVRFTSLTPGNVRVCTACIARPDTIWSTCISLAHFKHPACLHVRWLMLQLLPNPRAAAATAGAGPGRHDS